ncbi:ATP-dependent metallopeptidase Hfl [Massarina eburnea CBS 473.64]|uniref:ATP-dependent metallopeptidase Hfl n=1 Tax=Massarina eburnea CBS 473.64 TaxID=1395130 RepID=A0A6A6S4J2_9PLEO|nr:ATP-dependent metallopeptidase Hfl [Massarina eburnea CBS 473.64]
MAFQAPVAVQNAVAATSGLWPTMSAVLKSPWQGFGRQASADGSRHGAASPQAAPAPVAPAQARSSFALPDCLASVPMSALRAPSAPVAPIPTVAGTMSAVPMNVLRMCSPIIARSMPTSLAARQFSTFSRFASVSNARSFAKPGTVGLGLAQQRSLFGGPSHSQLARYEQTANNNPKSAAAQATFYSALLKANMPQIIIDRYTSGNFASNVVAETAYRQALEKTGQSENSEGVGGLTSHQLQAVGQALGARTGGGSVGKLRSGSGNKTDPLYVVVEESLASTIFKWVRWGAGFALAAYLALILISLFVETTGVLKKVGGGTSAEVRPESQSARFSDVQGCDEAKEELTDIVDFLKNPDRYNKLGGRLPKGVLLIGPPGTGKTLLARAVAGEAGVPFFYMSGSEFDEVYVGVGAKRVRELFTAARSKAPAIVFIDELDAIGGKRKSRDANYHRQTLNQLLNDLDGFDQSTGVIFIAATNHPEILDKALLRPGRFDRHVQVELPDVRGRLAILKHHTKKIRLSPEVDLSNIARGTPGFSGAELENLANTAAIQASKHQQKFVALVDLEWAKDKISMGSERKTRFVPLADKLQTAYHEGGHTLVGLYNKGFQELHKATILPRGQAAGITFFLPQEENHRSRQQYMVQLQVCMGGKMAEEIAFGEDHVGDGVSSDIEQATRLAYMMVTQFGFSDLLGNVDFRSNYEQVSPETKRLIDNEVRRLIDEAKESAKKLLLEKRSELDALATGLVQYETLDKAEIVKVIKGEKLPDRLMAMPDTPIKLPEIPLPLSVPPVRGGSGDNGVSAQTDDR